MLTYSLPYLFNPNIFNEITLAPEDIYSQEYNYSENICKFVSSCQDRDIFQKYEIFKHISSYPNVIIKDKQIHFLITETNLDIFLYTKLLSVEMKYHKLIQQNNILTDNESDIPDVLYFINSEKDILLNGTLSDLHIFDMFPQIKDNISLYLKLARNSTKGFYIKKIQQYISENIYEDIKQKEYITRKENKYISNPVKEFKSILCQFKK